MNREEIEKRLEELRRLYKLAVGEDRKIIKARGILLKRALEKVKKEDRVFEKAREIFGNK